MATLQQATDDAMFHKQAVVKVTSWRGEVEYYASSYPRKEVYIPAGYGGEVSTVADFRGVKA